jgi:hypothetical protein
LFGRIVLGNIPGIPLNYSIRNYSELVSKYGSMYSYFYRPASLFLEPAHFAQFMGPALLFVLFDEKRKNRFPVAVFFSIAVLLSTSTNAVVIVIVAWVSYLAYENLQTKNVQNLLRIISVVIAIIVIIAVSARFSETFSYGITRLQKLIAGSDASGSAYERVMKGFEIWKQLNILEKIFGIGFGTYDSYYSLGTLSVYNGEVEYMSSISYILVSGGIIGLTLFISAIAKYMRLRNYFNYALILFLTIVFFSSSVFNTPIYAIVMLRISHNCNSMRNNKGIVIDG